MISKKHLNTHMYIHTHIKDLLALNTVHVPVFLHTRTQQLRVAPDGKKIYSGCMCSFANQIKTIKLFEYEKNASKYSLFELSTPNNSTYYNRASSSLAISHLSSRHRETTGSDFKDAPNKKRRNK